MAARRTLFRFVSTVGGSAVVSGCLLGASGAWSAAPNTPRVKVPISGKYAGRAGLDKKIMLWITGKSVELVSLQFGCRGAVGTTNLDDLALKRGKGGYRFKIRAFGSATYSDTRPDENVFISIKGQFGRRGRVAHGSFKVRAGGCGHPHTARWSARR